MFIEDLFDGVFVIVRILWFFRNVLVLLIFMIGNFFIVKNFELLYNVEDNLRLVVEFEVEESNMFVIFKYIGNLDSDFFWRFWFDIWSEEDGIEVFNLNVVVGVFKVGVFLFCK